MTVWLLEWTTYTDYGYGPTKSYFRKVYSSEANAITARDARVAAASLMGATIVSASITPVVVDS